MPIYRFQGPDGKTHRVEAESPEAAQAGLESMWAQRQPTAPPQQAQQAQPRPNLTGQAAGFMANVNRGLGVGDEIAGAVKALPGAAQALLHARHGGGLGAVADAFKGGMADQRQTEDQYAQAHPTMAALGRGVGNAATLAVPAAPVAQIANASRIGNMTRGAIAAGGTGAAYAAADRGSAGDRRRMAGETARNPLVLALGAGGGALLPAASRARAKGEATPQQTLKGAGVSLTPGVQLGGIFKSTEDLAQRAPLIGPAIRGARQRSVESLARAQANRSLEPIGEGVPKAVKTGHASVAYVADRLGKEYDRAADMVQQVGRDAELKAGLAQVASAADELPTDVRTQFNTILKNRLDSRFGEGDVITGKQLREIQSDIGNIAAKRASSDDMAQQDLGHLLEQVSDHLKDTLGRYSPEAGEVIGRANQGWANYIRLRNAASRSMANGIPTVGQLSTAVRMSDRSVGKGNVAKGKAVMQDLASAAAQIMPDAFGNPGTADAVGLGALGMGLLTAPAQTAPVAGLLAAGAAPYMLMGRGVAEKSPRALRELAEALKRSPGAAALQAQVAARLGRTGGLLATSQAAPRN